MDMDGFKILNLNTTLLLLRNTFTQFTVFKFNLSSLPTWSFEESYCLNSYLRIHSSHPLACSYSNNNYIFLLSGNLLTILNLEIMTISIKKIIHKSRRHHKYFSCITNISNDGLKEICLKETS